MAQRPDLQGPDDTPARAAAPGSETEAKVTQDHETSAGAAPRHAGAGPTRRGILLGVLGGVVVVLGVLAVLWSRGTFTPEPLPGPTVTVTATVTAPPLAPAGATPAARKPGTAFGEAIPDTVLDLVLTSQKRHVATLRAGALDAWQVRYAASPERQVDVVAGQWRTAKQADKAAKAVVTRLKEDGAEVLERHDVVLANGKTAGRAWVVQTKDPAVAQIIWTNGSARFRVSGPLALVRDVYLGYRL